MINVLLVSMLSALMVVALYFWLGSVWACIAVFSFAAMICAWMFQLTNATTETMQSELRDRINDIRQQLTDLHGTIVSRLDSFFVRESDDTLTTRLDKISSQLDSLHAIAEFMGEQSHPNFAKAVKTFKDEQEEDGRKQAQRESEERHFKEDLDDRVRDARVERAKKANATREAFRQSHQTKQTE